MRIATGGAVPPIDHFGLVDREARGVGGLEARGVADGAVDVDHAAAGAADEVVVVVADAVFVAGGRAGGLDASEEAGVDEGGKSVEDRLMRDRPEGRPNGGLDLLGGGVRAVGDRLKDRHPLGGDLQATSSQAAGRVEGWAGAVRHEQGVVRQILDWVKNRAAGRSKSGHAPTGELKTRIDLK
jgi:hypothetical protein